VTEFDKVTLVAFITNKRLSHSIHGNGFQAMPLPIMQILSQNYLLPAVCCALGDIDRKYRNLASFLRTFPIHTFVIFSDPIRHGD
jgi:hypothetical protein